jgi:hypothetical protein
MDVNLNINVAIGLSEAAKGWIMSALSDAIAKVNTSTDAAIGRVQTDLASLKDQVAKLQAQIDAGGASPADLQALADLQAKVDALDPTSPATLP